MKIDTIDLIGFILVIFVIIFFGFGIYLLRNAGINDSLVKETCFEACAPYRVLACDNKNSEVFHPEKIDVFVACDSLEKTNLRIKK